MAADREPDTDSVTVVTRNANKWALVEMALAVAYVYYVTHPEIADTLTVKIQSWRHKIAHRLSVLRAQEAIRSLPETR